MDATELETNERALEVWVFWGDNALLRVEHLRAARSFWVADFELLGADGALRIPSDATGEVQVGASQVALSALIERGLARVEAGGWSYPLPPFASARLSYRGLTFVVRSVHAAKAIGHAPSFDLRAQLWTALSFALHAVFLGAMYFMPPGASALSLDTLSEDSRLMAYLMRPSELREPDWIAPKQHGGDEGKRAAEEGGEAGKPAAPQRQTAHATAGHATTKQLPREQARAQAKHVGILGALASARGAWNSPSSLFGGLEPLGYDPQDALGKLFGAQLGDAEGFAGLAPRGPGRGGDGEARGTLGVGELGTVGHAGKGDGPGYGSHVGGLGTRASHVPRLRMGDADVRGSLSKEAIRRVIQRRLNEVRFCYEQELTSRPDLRGRVQVKFLIAPSGAVQAAQLESSTLSASRAEQCITQAVRRWSFPTPDGGGVVIVSYPFVFDSAP